MKIVIDHNTSVLTDSAGNIFVTRLGMTGRIQTYGISTKEYSPLDIATWLYKRSNKLIQDEFPNMTPDDREFLMTGITPEEWKAMFPKGDK